MTYHALVVDDNPINRKLACAFFKGLGWTTQEAENGHNTIKILEDQPTMFDLLLMDISMPGISGSETCKILRENQKFHDLPIVAYTAHAFESEKEQMIEAGFNEILIKPTTKSNFEMVIKKYEY